jgi:hypothetical protein
MTYQSGRSVLDEGAYACCLQAYPTLQFEDFIKKCKSCPKKDGFTILDLKKVLE